MAKSKTVRGKRKSKRVGPDTDFMALSNPIRRAEHMTWIAATLTNDLATDASADELERAAFAAGEAAVMVNALGVEWLNLFNNRTR